MSISEPFVRRPIATSLLMARHFHGGSGGLPAAAGGATCREGGFSDHSGVRVQLPGASPEDLHGVRAVATPLEYQFARNFRTLSQMTSTNVLGSTADHFADSI